MATKKSTSSKKNLFDLIHDAIRWEYTEINDNKDSQKRRIPCFIIKQCLLLGVAAACCIICPNGISTDFAGYIISALSLFAGILFALALSLFDKYGSIDFTLYKKSINVDIYPIGVKIKNFYKKTIIQTLHTALIAVLCIVLLAINIVAEGCSDRNGLLTDFFSFLASIRVLPFCSIVFRALIIFFLFKFVVITLQLIAAFYDYMISEIDKQSLD